MEKSMRNPLLAGLFNMLVPGSVHMYINKEWRKFILTFIGTDLVLALVIWLGISIQNLPFFNIPQVLCPGALALLILVPLFVNGRRAASEHNKSQDDAVLYRSRKPLSQDTNSEQMKNFQKMRDTGLISEQEYESRKSKLSSDNKEQTQ